MGISTDLSYFPSNNIILLFWGGYLLVFGACLWEFVPKEHLQGQVTAVGWEDLAHNQHLVYAKEVQ